MIGWFSLTQEIDTVDLSIWIPTMVLLGLVTLGLMFAFVVACDKV